MPHFTLLILIQTKAGLTSQLLVQVVHALQFISLYLPCIWLRKVALFQWSSYLHYDQAYIAQVCRSCLKNSKIPDAMLTEH